MQALDDQTVPWDRAALIEDLKQQGLPLLEENLAKVVKTTFLWAHKSMDLSGGYYSQFGKPALTMVEKFIMTQIDKIDGETQGRGVE
jgi:hypothetical protein